MANNWQRSKIFYAISLGLEMGFLVAIPLVVFLFVGALLDKKFQTTPLFLAVSVILSFVVMLLELRFFILPFVEKRSQKKDDDNN